MGEAVGEAVDVDASIGLGAETVVQSLTTSATIISTLFPVELLFELNDE